MTTLRIAVPCLDGVPGDHVLGLIDAREDLRRRGVKVDVRYHPGDAMICRARNAIAADFLAEGIDLLLMVDADILFPRDAIARLVDWNVPVVGYNCRHRIPDVRWASVPEDGGEGPLVAARHLGTGMMLVRHDAFEELARARAARPDFPLESYDDGARTGVLGFFVPYVQTAPERTYLSEDWAFCARLRAAGVGVYIDTTVRPLHLGRQAFG